MTVGHILSFAPLLIGIWFAFLPETVPGFVLVVPMFIFDFIARLFVSAAVDHNRQDYGERDRTPWVDPSMNTNPSAEPGTVRIVGMVLLVLWFLLALLFRGRGCQVHVTSR
jgi:hypothetical protein